MKIAVCDDDEYYQAQLRLLLKKFISDNKEFDISVSIFSNATDLLKMAEKISGFDIYILDIVMPGIGGIDLGMTLRNNGDDGAIIYLTATEEYAIDSYKVDATNYILKPFVITDFFSTLKKSISSLSPKPGKNIIVRTKEKDVRISFDSILYAELCKRVVVYHLANGETIESIYLRVPFADAMQKLLNEPHFVLCRKSCLINLFPITEIGKEEITFNDTKTVYFGKKICDEVRPAWSDFLPH